MISKCWYLVFTKRDGKYHSFNIFKEISKECSSKAKMQHNMPRNSEEEVGKASGKSQGTRDAFQWLLRLGDRWWSPHIAAPPCPLTGGRTTLLQQDALASSTAPQKVVGRRVLRGPARRILTGGNA